MKDNSKRFFSILLITVIFLLIIQIVLSNRLTVEGKKLIKTQAEIETIEGENNNLKNKIVSIASLTKLTEQAEAMGFVKEPTIINLSNKIPVAAYNR